MSDGRKKRLTFWGVMTVPCTKRFVPTSESPLADVALDVIHIISIDVSTFFILLRGFILSWLG